MISLSLRFKGVIVALLVCVPFLGLAKPIRLRNETIDPPAPKGQLTVQTSPISLTQTGLVLIQFTNAPTTDQRAQLLSQGIELLRYVPENAYIARVRSVPSPRNALLPSAVFTTPYLAKYKLDTRLSAFAKGTNGVHSRVSVVLAPGLTPQERLMVRRLFARAPQENAMKVNPVLRGEISSLRLQSLTELSSVLWVEPDRPMKMHDEVSSKIVAGDNGVDGESYMQELGFDGTGVTVAVADSGLNNGDAETMHPDLAGRTPAFFYYGNLTDAADEHSHGTHVAGIIGGNGATGEKDDYGALYGLGVAPGAKIVAQRIFDGVGNYEAPPSYEKLTRDATQAGAVIGSNSWGDDTQGRYDISAAEFDELVRDADSTRAGDQPYILEFSAGNAGPGEQTMDSPAVGKNVIATGACQNDRFDFYIYDTGSDTMADFSSRGPCEDGRIKPDIVAPGTWIASLQSASATDENAWSPISPNYQYQGGTSQAGPHASGAAAIFVQYWRSSHTNATPSPALVKAALINSATPMDPDLEVGYAPNNDEGWGRIDLPNLVSHTRHYDYTDQSILMTNGQLWERRLIVKTSDEPFKVTLTYSDVPGLPATIPALVNDLDLEVVSPSGIIYKGNQFDKGESTINPASADALNNVEGVYLSFPMPGEYIVRIRASHIVDDARRDTAAIDQDFALVVSGDLPLPGTSVLLMDRRSYTAPSQINLQLINPELAGQPTAQVILRSRTETNNHPVTLSASGGFGVFKGSIATVSGSASSGRLQITHGDWIEGSYTTPQGQTILASATADLIPPLLTNVAATNEFGQLFISWTSDEIANSVLLYGTNSTSLVGTTNYALGTSHAIALSKLNPGQTYFYAIASTDEAGNTATNNNNGLFFQVTTAPAKAVLLVNAYTPDTETTPLPLEGYTGALDQIGVSYEVWDVAQRGSPTTNTLNQYQVVMWRLSDSPYSADTLSVSQQQAINSYVLNGGGFFLASMEALSRMGDVPFRTNILHISRFTPNPNPFDITPSADEDCTVPGIDGTSGDPIGSGVSLLLDYSAFPMIDLGFFVIGPDFSDTFGVDTNAVPIFSDMENGRSCGMRYPKTGQESKGRVVFFSFPLDAIPQDQSAPNTRASILGRALQFLAPGINNTVSITLDSPSYTLPSVVTVELADLTMAGKGNASIVFSTTSHTNGVSVIAKETSRQGFFRATIRLVGTSPGAGEVQGIGGDTLRADYYDSAGHGPTRAIAVVDIIPPIISEVDATADYQAITFTWETSKPSDSLVQLGTSLFFGRTGYDPILTTSHEITIGGLLPDTDYYFQITSRDISGNSAVDFDASANKVRTLRPLSLPWSNAMETTNGWDKYSDPDMGGNWVLGTPNNSAASEAHSPLNAWGSNLNGTYSDSSDTFLISPALYVTQGALLHFWHAYDFTEKTDGDIIEGGNVYVFVNNTLGNPILEYAGDFTFGWEEATLDLSPYAGQVVNIIWEYQLFSVDPAPRSGWTIDDVSITVTGPGRITITNNLWQSGWTLTGPTNLSGGGLSVLLTNLAAGDYTLTWKDVEFYDKPASQAGTLAPGSLLSFAGDYQITNNHNGLPDAWAQRYFGFIDSTTATNDMDHDGMSNYAEFIAGTDPTNTASVLKLSENRPIGTNPVVLSWPLATNHAYRVLGSTNAVLWSPVSDWLFNTNRFALPKPKAGNPYLFRVQVGQ